MFRGYYRLVSCNNAPFSCFSSCLSHMMPCSLFLVACTLLCPPKTVCPLPCYPPDSSLLCVFSLLLSSHSLLSKYNLGIVHILLLWVQPALAHPHTWGGCSVQRYTVSFHIFLWLPQVIDCPSLLVIPCGALGPCAWRSMMQRWLPDWLHELWSHR